MLRPVLGSCDRMWALRVADLRVGMFCPIVHWRIERGITKGMEQITISHADTAALRRLVRDAVSTRCTGDLAPLRAALDRIDCRSDQGGEREKALLTAIDAAFVAMPNDLPPGLVRDPVGTCIERLESLLVELDRYCAHR